jgi:membrane associated rhomboid family serine protease
VATILLDNNIDLYKIFGLHYITASDFRPWQLITYMFMHGDFNHLFFNMLAVWMFGSVLERYWGSKRFLCYYFVTGIGAGLVHYIIIAIQIHSTMELMNGFINQPSLESLKYLVETNTNELLTYNFQSLYQYALQNPSEITAMTSNMIALKGSYLNHFNVVGASGSVFGLLLAFGMLFPNSEIYLYFLIPIKAKWFVIIYGLLELILGALGSNDGVAHFAHLGGMIFGIFMILYWKKHDRNKNAYS